MSLSQFLQIEKELKRLDTTRNLPFTIALIDVNGLKLINDAFGHLVGDELLSKVSDILKTECRSDDIIARIGGDEFIILLPKTKDEEAHIIIKRIYKAIAAEKLSNLLISVADAYEAMTSERSYNKVLSKEQAMAELKKNSGTQFDPNIIEAFATIYEFVN